MLVNSNYSILSCSVLEMTEKTPFFFFAYLSHIDCIFFVSNRPYLDSFLIKADDSQTLCHWLFYLPRVYDSCKVVQVF